MTYTPDINLILLFPTYPREVGNPFRKVVNSFKEFIEFVKKYNGITDVFVSVYDLNFTIDKIFIDIDAPSLQIAMETAKLIEKKCEEHDIPYIPVFSGRRGFHFYLLFSPWSPPNLDIAKFVVKQFVLDFFRDVKYIDSHCIGNLRQLARVPNTKHPEGLYAVFLPHGFSSWSSNQLLKYASRPQHVDYGYTRLPDIRVFIDVDSIVLPEPDFYVPFSKLRSRHLPESRQRLYEYLRRILRPCVAYEVVFNSNPHHWVRTDFVSELVWLGYSVDEICEIIRRLKWDDYNPRLTRYHVEKIFEKRLLPLSCSKLRQYVMKCFKCGWMYFWTRLDFSPNSQWKSS